MNKEKNFSRKIRLRLLFQTLLTIVPVIILIIYLNIVSLNISKQTEIKQLKNAARLIATEQIQIIEGARQQLITLSTTYQVNNPTDNCSNYLSEILHKYQRYTNFALTDKDGNVICSAIPPKSPISVSDRYFFKKIVKTKAFNIGEYSVSKITKQSIISFGYPVFDTNGTFSGVIYSSLDLDWLNDLVNNLELSDKAVLMILDRKGVVLAKSMNQNSVVGTRYSSDTLIKALNDPDGFIEIKDKNKELYFYAFQEIDLTKSSPYVVLGLPESSIYEQPNKEFQKAILISLIIGFISVIVGWFTGQSLITNVFTAINKVDELKRDFVSLVSHQLRTPLTAIKYFNEILLSENPGKLKPKQKEFLEDSLASTNRLISLVGTLLNISRLESGKIQLQTKKVSLPSLVKTNQKELAYLFAQKKLKFILHNKTTPQVLIDEKLIGQVITNLLINATKYSESKTIVETTITHTRHEVIVSIKNHGIAILDDEKEHIFTKFFRTPAASKADSEGSGLGLYLCTLIIGLHNGRIWHTSSKDKSTTFFFALPY